MNTQLASEQAQFLKAAIASGKYEDERAALTEAVKLLQRRDEFVQSLIDADDDIEAGNGIPAEVVFERLQKKLATYRQKEAS